METTKADAQLIPVIGYGPIGREVTRQLLVRGFRVCVMQRRAPDELPTDATFSRLTRWTRSISPMQLAEPRLSCS